MFEKKNQALISPREFRRRVLKFLLIAFGVTFLWVLVGTLGFRALTELSWLDSFYNASMIASEMGPVFVLDSAGAKIFTAAYALVSGLVFAAVLGIAIAPILHRFFHIFHLEAPDANDGLDSL